MAKSKYLLKLQPEEIIHFILERQEEDGTLVGRFYNMPNQIIRVVMPYPVFDSIEELIQHYNHLFERYGKR